MQTPATKIDQMIVQLTEFILPSSLMESFDVYREESVKSAARLNRSSDVFPAALAGNDEVMKPGSWSVKHGEIIANKRRIYP